MSSRVAESLQRLPSEPKKRNLFSCDNCRHAKKFCHFPPTQNESERSPPCARCQEKNLLCSGPVYIPRPKKSSKSIENTVVAVDVQPAEDDELSRKRTRDTIEQDSVMSQSTAARYPSGPRPMLQAWGLTGTASSDDDVPDPKQVLVQLGNLNAARELLRSCICVCDDVRSWRPDCDSTIANEIQSSLESIKASVEAKFMNLLDQAEVDAEMNAHYDSDIYAIMVRFQHPPNRPTKLNLSNDTPQGLDSVFDRIHKKRFAQRRTDGVYSVADHLCHEVCTTMSSGRMPRLGLDPRRFLQSAFQAIDKIMKGIQISHLNNAMFHPSNTLSDKNLSLDSISFPLLHLTLLQADDAVLRFYAQKNQKRLFEVDLLGRTIFHLAAYFGRTSFVELTLEDHVDKRILSTIKQDAFKLYPHMIAACRNDVEALKLFVKHGADLSTFDANNQTCLDLAVQTEATDVVRWLLHNGYGNYSRGNPLRQAVSLIQFRIIEVYIQFYSTHDHHNYDDIVDAARLAEELNFPLIAARLHNLYVNQPSYQAQALESLTTLEFHNSCNMPLVDLAASQVTLYALPNSQITSESPFSSSYDPFMPHMHGSNGFLQPSDQG